ncbi:rhodanese-like domain-containing protein [Malonomonas rubra]|uniref:rhodanese-like domain-containing protein n=1 Tax=Malonomonas rubra TaxID=57040 RepID=UPI0026E9850A|nr:rhodanese-like domain-containing protein [Malonomonas rubra]
MQITHLSQSDNIPEAIHVPMWKILFRLANLLQGKNTEMVLTCEHGPRARVVRGLLTKSGYFNQFFLDGDMTGWLRAGLITDK